MKPTVKYCFLVALIPVGLCCGLSQHQLFAESKNPISINSTPDCLSMNKERDHNLETLFILDRTTILDAATQNRWNNGIDSILTSGEVVGDVRVAEVRENSVRMDELGGGCLDRYTRDDPASSDSRLYKWGNEAVRSIIEFFTGKDDEAVRRRIETALQARDTLRLQLQQLVRVNKPTRSDSEIAVSLVDELHSYCSHRRRCQIFIFSDMVDTKVKMSYKSKARQDAAALGKDRAVALTEEFRLGEKSTTMRFIVWGFGRDDSRPGVELPELERRFLHRYWSGFFQEVNSRYSPDSSCVISNSLDLVHDAGDCR